jgi:hypothetical protein
VQDGYWFHWETGELVGKARQGRERANPGTGLQAPPKNIFRTGIFLFLGQDFIFSASKISLVSILNTSTISHCYSDDATNVAEKNKRKSSKSHALPADRAQKYPGLF